MLQTEIFGVPQPSTLGLSLSIIHVLKSYNRPIPVDFVAHVLGRDKSEIESDLVLLENKGAVRREGDKVAIRTD